MGAVALHADPLSRNSGLTGKPFSLGEVTTMTATLRQRGSSTWAMTAMRRMIGTLRYVSEELVHAHEALARPAGAPLSRRGAGTTASSAAADASEAASAGGAKPAA
jgi:hypothetical protein